jgi:hypothetical protein
VIVCHVGIIAVAYGAVCFLASGRVGQWRYCFQFGNLTVYIRVRGIEMPRTSKQHIVVVVASVLVGIDGFEIYHFGLVGIRSDFEIGRRGQSSGSCKSKCKGK